VSTAPKNLTDPEREHFVRQIHDLERKLRWWRLTSLVLLGVLLLPIVLGGLLGVTWVPRLERQRVRAAEAEMRGREAMEEELRARQAAEDALQQAERQRALAEEEVRRRAPQGPGEDKP
jgi:cell division protein FtsL